MIIATANLVECRQIDMRLRSVVIAKYHPYEIDFGDYTTGRYAWYLEHVTPLPEPIPAKGSLGLWEWTA